MAITRISNLTASAPALTDAQGIYTGGTTNSNGILDFIFGASGLNWTRTGLGAFQTAFTQPGSTNGFTLQVDDSAATGTTTASAAKITGWETLSALNVGTGEFPDSSTQTTQSATSGPGYWLQRANTASPSPAQAWRCFSNGNLTYLFVQWTNAALADYSSFVFGDFVSYKAGDAFNTILGGQISAGVTTGMVGANVSAAVNTNGTTSANNSYTAPRAYSQIGASINLNLMSDEGRSGGIFISGNCAVATSPYPDPVSGSLILTPIWVIEGTGSPSLGAMRGLLPGAWFINHPSVFPEGYTFTVSSGLLAGRSFEIVGPQATTTGQLAIETSNTWGGF